MIVEDELVAVFGAAGAADVLRAAASPENAELAAHARELREAGVDVAALALDDDPDAFEKTLAVWRPTWATRARMRTMGPRRGGRRAPRRARRATGARARAAPADDGPPGGSRQDDVAAARRAVGEGVICVALDVSVRKANVCP